MSVSAKHLGPSPDSGSASSPATAIPCDGTPRLHTLPVAVSAATALLTFTFNVTATCVQ